jgi:hypothetical protein
VFGPESKIKDPNNELELFCLQDWKIIGSLQLENDAGEFSFGLI